MHQPRAYHSGSALAWILCLIAFGLLSAVCYFLAAKNADQLISAGQLKDDHANLTGRLAWNEVKEAISAGLVVQESSYPDRAYRLYLAKRANPTIDSFLPITGTVKEEPLGEYTLKEPVAKLNFELTKDDTGFFWLPLPKLRSHGLVTLEIKSSRKIDTGAQASFQLMERYPHQTWVRPDGIGLWVKFIEIPIPYHF